MDGELYGIRESDKQVKTLGNRTANAEGHAADCIADVLYQEKLDVRFTRRGEKKGVAAALELRRLVETRREVDRNRILVTADRCYARINVLSEVQMVGK